MSYIIQGQKPPLPRDPVEMNGAVYVPVQDIAEILGGSLEREEDAPNAVVSITPWKAEITVGAADANVNGTTVSFSARVVDQDGSLWAPSDFFQTAFGYEVSTRGMEVSITNPNVEL